MQQKIHIIIDIDNIDNDYRFKVTKKKTQEVECHF